jgi:hypothetical protein
MARKPEYFDLAMEALGHQLCEMEHLYVMTRFLYLAAIDRIVELEAELRKVKHFHALDVAQLRALLDADFEILGHGEA